MRFTKLDYSVHPCTSPTESPTACLPAVDINEAVEGDTCRYSDFASSRIIIKALKARVCDLDAHLSSSQRSDILAYSQLVSTSLDVATSMSIWGEAVGFQEWKKAAYGSSLPLPLNFIIPWYDRRGASRKLEGLIAEEVYSKAAETLSALADRLRTSAGAYFLGTRPSSLDALVFGHLVFYRYSPAAAPVLRSMLEGHGVLTTFIDHVLRDWFSSQAVPHVPSEDASWSGAAQGQKREKKVPPTAEELKMRRHGQLWLLGAGLAIATYVLLGGQYVVFTEVGEGDDDDDDDE